MPRDERGVIAIFRNHMTPNEGKSAQAGRPIFDDVEICELRFAGSRNVFVFPATSMSHWDDGADGLGHRIITYAERFPLQYQQFRTRQHQTKVGTPLDYLPFLTEARRAELRALNIYTAEALSIVDGAELKNLGPQGREFKQAAIEFLERSDDNARLSQMQQRIDELMAQQEVLKQDLERAKSNGNGAEKKPTYDDMSDDQLRAHVKTVTGIEPKGNLPRKTLIRMAEEQREARAA